MNPNSSKNIILVSTLTSALARYLRQTTGAYPTYFHLRVSADQWNWPSAEIAFLDRKLKARRSSKKSTEELAGARILAFAQQLAADWAPFSASPNPNGLSLKLEAVEIGYRWCVNVTVTAYIENERRHATRSFQCRVRSLMDETPSLAA
jgi:hypothetical protein